MDFGYTPEQQSLRDDVRAFIAENVTDELMEEIEGSGGEGGRGPRSVSSTKTSRIRAGSGSPGRRSTAGRTATGSTSTS